MKRDICMPVSQSSQQTCVLNDVQRRGIILHYHNNTLHTLCLYIYQKSLNHSTAGIECAEINMGDSKYDHHHVFHFMEPASQQRALCCQYLSCDS